ncbi:hypothetical protein ccbrp13_33750 [Ktedonobacteria bacterium brp13]|nr:hypothetical protein ccbrp13_33750 [Ktedonobacteria bacterium brp13]
MPKRLQARTAQDEREELQVRKLAGSHHAPADWKFHAQMVVESWAGKTPQEIATILDCHPKQCASTWPDSTKKGSTGWGCEKARGASRA